VFIGKRYIIFDMKRNNATISIFSTIWGHHSIGKAVEDALELKYHPYFNFIKPEALGAKSYTSLYLLFPSFNKIPFKISESERISKIAVRYLYKSYSKKIEELIKKQKPEIVISVYFAFSLVLEKLSKKYHFTFINIVADPRTLHKLILFKDAYNFLFDKKSLRRGIQLGLDRRQCIQSGWFVRKEFQKMKNKQRARSSLGLNPKLFTVSVIGGSAGTLNVLKILPAFFALDKKIQVILICGNNKKLYKSLHSLLEILDLKSNSNTSFFIKGFTLNTHEYLQASDIVIGKAGPNLLFESVAVQTPFFAVSHVAGQEDGNLEIIKEYKLGFVEENPVKAIKLTKKIINNPKILNRFSEPLERLSAYNRNSYIILQKFIEKRLKEEI
jgi:processive 1,2-diacylglycerol beta-glucosyltransferase